MKSNKFYNMIGLAAKAGKAAFGSDNTLQFIRTGRAKLVILAGDASGATQKRILDKCESYGVEALACVSKSRLGKVAGREETAAAAILDDNFAIELLRLGKEIMGVFE